MATCFVIQPFDKGKYDKRFEDVFKPAIQAAGLEAYRVDRDPGVVVPIDSIEDGIRNAAACLADITDDNPNVWYELGYASARGRPLLMVCSNERTTFPFDIQHRSIITYASESSSDFTTLGKSITARLKARLSNSEGIRQLEETEQIAPVAGLGAPELLVLATIAGNTYPGGHGVSIFSIKNEAERAGLTAVGFSLGIRRLQSKGLIQTVEQSDFNDNPYHAAVLLDNGWDWIDKNETKFLLRKERTKPDDFDDDIPF